MNKCKRKQYQQICKFFFFFNMTFPSNNSMKTKAFNRIKLRDTYNM